MECKGFSYENKKKDIIIFWNEIRWLMMAHTNNNSNNNNLTNNTEFVLLGESIKWARKHTGYKL